MKKHSHGHFSARTQRRGLNRNRPHLVHRAQMPWHQVTSLFERQRRLRCRYLPIAPNRRSNE